ncbi:helix-turn-helix domain-containing protein [Streptomyces sp. NEAU-YJ-81]|uniref:helix-turn-helix domain-containing protein n=1 Tax=Streptomyces sp. NEAU-YJ-81 TaxID=2820288 RepID=UPI001ABC5CC7|nr:helix-turn-helix domain-containing protein [Streptomyces sp. NEAU-YJ-81]MBO3682717.1 helix-turn-helix domain-containing protein [Streptomyces sp. NEAU-YJ-81]
MPELVGCGVGVLDRAFAMLDVIAQGVASPAEIAAATGIPRSSVVRLLRAMIILGLVAREGGQIMIGPRTAPLAAAADGGPMAGPGAEKLAALRVATGASAVRLHQRCGPAGTVRVCSAEVLDPHAPDRPQLGVSIPLIADPVTQTFLAWQSAGPIRGASCRTVPYTPDILTWTRRRGWAQGVIGRDRRLAIAALTTAPGRVHGRALIKAASESDVISECHYHSGEAVGRGAPRAVSSLHLLTTTRRRTV